MGSQMEEVVHEVRNDAQAFRRRRMIAIRRQLPRLESPQRSSLLRIKIWTVGVEPLDRLLGDLVAVRVIRELELAVRD